jgi:hypothetical protein
MTENLTKSFIDHRNVGLASQSVAELAFHHRERGFDVRPFVVMRHEFVAPKLEVMEHFRPCSAAVSGSADPLLWPAPFRAQLRSDAFLGGAKYKGITLLLYWGSYFISYI